MKSNAPDLEYYGENGLVEVWIAVEKSKESGKPDSFHGNAASTSAAYLCDDFSRGLLCV